MLQILYDQYETHSHTSNQILKTPLHNLLQVTISYFIFIFYIVTIYLYILTLLMKGRIQCGAYGAKAPPKYQLKNKKIDQNPFRIKEVRAENVTCVASLTAQPPNRKPPSYVNKTSWNHCDILVNIIIIIIILHY